VFFSQGGALEIVLVIFVSVLLLAFGVFISYLKLRIANKSSDDIQKYLNEQLLMMSDCLLSMAQELEKNETLIQLQKLQVMRSRGEKYPYFDTLCSIHDTLAIDNDESFSVLHHEFETSKDNFERAVNMYGYKVSLFPTAMRITQNSEKDNE
jgi:hypothetical protein